MAAGYAQVKMCLAEGFYEELADRTREFVERINRHCLKKDYPLHLFSIASIFWFAFSKATSIHAASEIKAESMEYFKQMHRLLLQKGVYLGPSGYEVGFVSAAHTRPVLKDAAEVMCACLDEIFR